MTTLNYRWNLIKDKLDFIMSHILKEGYDGFDLINNSKGDNIFEYDTELQNEIEKNVGIYKIMSYVITTAPEYSTYFGYLSIIRKTSYPTKFKSWNEIELLVKSIK